MKNFPNWARIGRTIANVPLASGYRFELLQDHVIFCDSPCRDGVVSGDQRRQRKLLSARGLLSRSRVPAPGGAEKDVLVVLIKAGAELAGMFSCERDLNTLSLYAKLGVVAPRHRGVGLGHAIVSLAEAIGRDVGMEMIYGMATLKVPHVQRAFETLGWRLIGITPGFDREMVAPGVVKRVYEAVYAKVLVAENRTLASACAKSDPRYSRVLSDAVPPQARLQT